MLITLFDKTANVNLGEFNAILKGSGIDEHLEVTIPEKIDPKHTLMAIGSGKWKVYLIEN